jgi:hypothetical protein
VRNTLSARRLASAAKTSNTTAAYREYVARGGRQSDIIELLLPRAELDEAKAQGSAAIEAYVASHPGSKIQGEVDTALRSALLVALGRARAPGTLAALEAFAAAHPKHEPVEKELAAARHEVYRTAADRARELAVSGTGKDADPADFFGRLVAYAEAHGPKVQIRFRSQLGKSYHAADKALRSSPYFSGKANLPSRYFVDDYMRQREALAGALLASALQGLFAPEIVRFEAGDPLVPVPVDERPEPLPAPSVPTLFIAHRTELSGSVVIQKPRGMFTGAAVFFDAFFALPGDADPLRFTIPTWLAPTRQVMRHKGRTIADVYEDLSRRSFTMFLRRYLVRVLKAPPQLGLPAIDLMRDQEPEQDQDERAG